MSLPAVFGANVNPFKINHFRRFANNISLENKLVLFHQNPRPALFDATAAALPKSIRVDQERVHPALFKSHGGMYGHDA